LQIALGVKRGSARFIILAILESGPAHGYNIATQIEYQTKGVLTFDVASLYPLLHQLESKGWVILQKQKIPTPRRRRCYELTSKGERQLRLMRIEWQVYFDALDAITNFRALTRSDLGESEIHSPTRTLPSNNR